MPLYNCRMYASQLRRPDLAFGIIAYPNKWFLPEVLTTLLFAAMFKILPDVLLSWRDVLVGAFITAVLFAAGRSLIALYLAYSATASAYGAAGSLALLLLWVNYSSMILLFGAAFTRAHLEGRGLEVRPKRTAVRVQRELIVD